MSGLPANVAHGTVTGQIVRATHLGGDTDVDAQAVAGSATFTPSVSMLRHAGSDLVIVPKPVTTTLDGNGAFSAKLIATDDTDLSPTGWTYRATFTVQGGGAVTPFDFSVPTDSVQDIADLLGSV